MAHFAPIVLLLVQIAYLLAFEVLDLAGRKKKANKVKA